MSMRGPRSKFRGKVRTPVVVTFTPEGHAALTHGMLRTGLSRADYIETLLRRAEARARRQEVDADSGGDESPVEIGQSS